MSLSLICAKETIYHRPVPTPRLEHFEVCVQQCLCKQVSETILPLLRKVKQLGWYRGDVGVPTFENVFKGPLQSLEVVETATRLLFPFGVGPIGMYAISERPHY